MHGRLHVSSRLIYVSGASLGITIGLYLVFRARGLSGAANLAQLISLIPISSFIAGEAQRRRGSSKSIAERDNSGHANSSAASGEEAGGEEAEGKDVEHAEGEPDSTPPKADLGQRLDGAFVAPVALVLCAVLASVIVIVAHFGFNNDPGGHAPSKSFSLPNGLTVQPDLALTDANYCKWRSANHPMPLAAAKPPTFFIDNRCVVPVDADPSDPTMDDTTPVRDGTSKDDTQVAALTDGEKISPLCWTFGQDFGMTLGTNPPVYEMNNLWLKVRTPDGKIGYLPDVYIGGGGYSERQLTGLGMSRCD
jgi:hypothetical protein